MQRNGFHCYIFGFGCDNIFCKLSSTTSEADYWCNGLRSCVNTTGQEVKTNDVLHTLVLIAAYQPCFPTANGGFPSCLWACVCWEPPVTVHVKYVQFTISSWNPFICCSMLDFIISFIVSCCFRLFSFINCVARITGSHLPPQHHSDIG